MSIENDLQVSKETIRKYEERDNYHLYFWKEKEKIIGLTGIKIRDPVLIVHHIAINPSFRNEGISHAMIAKAQHL